MNKHIKKLKNRKEIRWLLPATQRSTVFSVKHIPYRTLCIAAILILTLTPGLSAQSESKLIRQGNRSYEKGAYSEAEINYLKAIQSEDPSHKGLFNLGDALYQQDNYLEASSVFDSATLMNLEKPVKSQVYYNLGNALLKLAKDSAEMAQQALPASIESYKQSLRLNPDDHEAKYNLAYAQNLLKEQQQQQQQQQNQDQDKGQDQQEKQEQQDEQQEQQKKQQEAGKQEQEKNARPEERKISKQEAERMLQALKNDEKKILEKLQQLNARQAKGAKSEKDW